MLHEERNVSGVKGTLVGMMNVVSANVRVLNGVAGGMNFNGKGGGGVLHLPALAEANDRVN